MRKWTGQRGQQTQCLLCYYGLTKLPAARATSIRSLTTTSSNQKEQDQRVTRKLRNRIYAARQMGGLEEKSAISSFKRLNLRKSNRPPKVRLDTALKTVYKRLTKRLDDDPSLLTNLDVHDEAWDDFKDNMHAQLAQDKADPNGKQKETSSELMRLLNGQEPQAVLENYLHYAFLDRSLASKSLDVTNAMDLSIDMRYPTEWYPAARAKQREVHLHIGPTNSGKTYNALKRLEAAETGFYAGPLRLLAHEVYSRFNARGIPCNLVTGDDIRLEIPDPDLTIRYASTVEMVDVSTNVDVAVIDEIQMIADGDRGWAWTRAFLGCCANEVHLCGEPRILPLIKELCASMGDNLHVHRYERLNPLKVMSKSMQGDFKRLRKGDCVVTFSIMNIHALRKHIEAETGRRVAIVYGSLPPETRAEQAALFNNPDNNYDFLVASDAIGMGLNLSIKRIIFDAVHKFDGVARRQLSVPQIKQIAGRAGRYRTARDDSGKDPTDKGDPTSIGLVTSIDEGDLPVIRTALSQEAPPIRQAGLLPLGDHVISYANRLPPGVPYDYIMQRICDAASIHPRFSLCRIRDQIGIAREIEVVRALSFSERTVFTASPAEYKTALGKDVVRALARAVGEKRQVNIADVQAIPLEVLEQPLSPNPVYLERLEGLHRSLILFLWLSYRFTSVFTDQDMAFHAKAMTESKINSYLRTYSANKRRRGSAFDASATEKLKGARHIPLSGATPDFSEHATETLEEEIPSESSKSAALPIDWAQGAEDIAVQAPEEDSNAPAERAANVPS